MIGLRWKYVSSDSITVNETFCDDEWGAPKSEASNATIGVNRCVIECIERLKTLTIHVRAGKGAVRRPPRGGPSRQNLDERRFALEALGRFIGLLVWDRLPGHVAEARVKLWLRSERERGEREAAGNVIEFPAAIAATVSP